MTLFIEAWVVPNNIRYTTIDTTRDSIHKDIPHHLITFTWDSSAHICKLSDYMDLENLASTLLQQISEDIQIVIEVTGRSKNGELKGMIHVYDILKPHWKVTWLYKRNLYSIQNRIRPTEATKHGTQTSVVNLL